MQPVAVLGRRRRDRNLLPAGASVTDLAIGQLLGLADSAQVKLDVIDGRLEVVSANPDWRQWATIKKCLEEIGLEAVVEFLTCSSPTRRAALSATARS
jgi:hypothetical protein